MSRPAVSIVIPLYNAASFITETLRSVQAQICSDFEVIVVDDGSRDRSAECVAAVAREDSRIRLHRQGNAGVSFLNNMTIQPFEYQTQGILKLELDSDQNKHIYDVHYEKFNEYMLAYAVE